jgi:hypothetical protein
MKLVMAKRFQFTISALSSVLSILNLSNCAESFSPSSSWTFFLALWAEERLENAKFLNLGSKNVATLNVLLRSTFPKRSFIPWRQSLINFCVGGKKSF